MLIIILIHHEFILYHYNWYFKRREWNKMKRKENLFYISILKMEWKLDLYYLFFDLDYNGVISSSDNYLDKDDQVYYLLFIVTKIFVIVILI